MADLSKPRVIAVGGPTASGKTALSVGLAKAFGGEIINADSMQIYKNLDVGTAKPSIEERQGVPHYLLDFLPPETPYSVADFTAAADPLIQEITARGKLPLVVGGTGLYITSLLNGMAFAPEKTDPAIRARLQERAEAEGGAALYAELQSIDPETDEPVEKAAEWQEQAYRLAAELGKQMVEQAGTAAFIGHRVPDKKNSEKSYLYTAPKAYNSFLYELRKLYPKQNEGGTE